MFPQADSPLTPELTVWAALSALSYFAGAAASADVAQHLRQIGFAVGEHAAVEDRVRQFLENLVAAPPGSRGAVRLPDGRYKPVLRQPSHR